MDCDATLIISLILILFIFIVIFYITMEIHYCVEKKYEYLEEKINVEKQIRGVRKNKEDSGCVEKKLKKIMK